MQATALILFLLYFAIPALGCSSQGPRVLPEELFQQWRHSHEEDTEEARVFRPVDYDFPPSRGREGFEIREDGGFLYYRIAAADGLEAHRGTWKAEGHKRIELNFEDDGETVVWEIISLSSELLRIRK